MTPIRVGSAQRSRGLPSPTGQGLRICRIIRSALSRARIENRRAHDGEQKRVHYFNAPAVGFKKRCQPADKAELTSLNRIPDSVHRRLRL